MKLLRNVLGILSLVLGLALLGECAAHTMRSLLVQGVQGDLSFFILKGAFFAPARHGAAYQILLGSGTLLTVLGVVLTRTWALPFFLLSALCFAVLGGTAVERGVLKRGEEASLMQDGVSGLGTLFSGDYGDPVMVLGLGVFGLLTGLYLTHGLGSRRPQARPAATGRPRPAGLSSLPEAPADVPPEPGGNPLEEPVEPPPEEAGADTSVALDLSPDVATSEVLSPEAPPPEKPPEPAPFPEESSRSSEDRADNPVPSDPGPLEAPPASRRRALVFSVPALLLGLGALAVPVTQLSAPELFPSVASLGQAWGAGVASGLAGLGLAFLAKPKGPVGILALGASAAGLAGAGTLLALGG